MKGMAVVIGALVALLVAAVAYGIWWEVNDPGHGTITDKSHRGSYMTCSTVNKVTTCQNHPECWRVVYTDGKHDGDACVPQREWETYKVGDWYPAGAR